MEMLFLFAFAFGRQSAAAVFHLTSLFALAAMMTSYGRRMGEAKAGVCGALLVFVSPVMGTDAASAYNDVALACAGFAVFYLLEIWREQEDNRLLIPAGLSAGFCFAIKYTGGVALAPHHAMVSARGQPHPA
jgi:4-amino-4-deoxy-L-arabinose transferase-like glycosyltransferase